MNFLLFWLRRYKYKSASKPQNKQNRMQNQQELAESTSNLAAKTSLIKDLLP